MAVKNVNCFCLFPNTRGFIISWKSRSGTRTFPPLPSGLTGPWRVCGSGSLMVMVGCAPQNLLLNNLEVELSGTWEKINLSCTEPKYCHTVYIVWTPDTCGQKGLGSRLQCTVLQLLGHQQHCAPKFQTGPVSLTARTRNTAHQTLCCWQTDGQCFSI